MSKNNQILVGRIIKYRKINMQVFVVGEAVLAFAYRGGHRNFIDNDDLAVI